MIKGGVFLRLLSCDYLKQVDELLSKGNQSWLLGAGISFNAGIPLMNPLTDRIIKQAEKASNKNTYSLIHAIKNELPSKAHIEHILSQIGDYAAVATRKEEKMIKMGRKKLDVNQLEDAHNNIVKWIADIVRWGYRPEKNGLPEQCGTCGNSIINIMEHKNFISSLFNCCQAGVEQRRSAVKIFTTNYDTLLEDAMSLNSINYWDGFSGGAVAFREYKFGDNEPEKHYRAHIIKLHGSIDWRWNREEQIFRVRDGDKYPEGDARIMIYPQATKYLATQRDPFAAQFDLFRRTLAQSNENVLAVCGYSFGDDHINDEIEMAMQKTDNKTTIIAFSQGRNEVLVRWGNSSWSKRLYVIAADGMYVGNEGPFFAPSSGAKKDWWTFGGVTKILQDGAEVYGV